MTGQRKVTVKVRDGFGVYLDGESHNGGAVLDVPADLAANWLAGGFVEKATSKPTSTSSSKGKAQAGKRTTAKPATASNRQAASQPRHP